MLSSARTERTIYSDIPAALRSHLKTNHKMDDVKFLILWNPKEYSNEIPIKQLTGTFCNALNSLHNLELNIDKREFKGSNSPMRKKDEEVQT
jgi:hypothetical protein